MNLFTDLNLRYELEKRDREIADLKAALANPKTTTFMGYVRGDHNAPEIVRSRFNNYCGGEWTAEVEND